MSPFDAEYEPSPWEPIAEEVARYERSGGSEASDLVGDEWIILWTVGAQSGKVRKTPLVRVADGDGNYAVVGSMGGAPTHPQWVHNVRPSRWPGCRTAPSCATSPCARSTATRRRRGGRAVAVWPDYDAYQAGTDRVIPLFVLEPTT
ncbi:MAG: nitroreductase/quinone reductase family protein [Acidimicrobiales bacterium]